MTAAPISATPISKTMSTPNSRTPSDKTQRVLIEFQNLRRGHTRDTEQGSPPQEPLVNTHRRGHFIDQVRVFAKVGQLIVRQL